MIERLLEKEKNTNMEQLVAQINKIIDEKFSILDEKDDIEKWNGIPKLLLLEEPVQKKFLEFVDFMDSLLVPIEDKVIYVVSLSGLMEFGGVNLEKYDVGSLFMMADYYQNSTITEIKNTIIIAGNLELLTAIRLKTLDLEARKKILRKIVEGFFQPKRNKVDNKVISKYITDSIQMIQMTDYYELMK